LLLPVLKAEEGTQLHLNVLLNAGSSFLILSDALRLTEASPQSKLAPLAASGC